MPLPQTPPLPGPGSYEVVDYEGPSKHYMSGAAFVSTTSRWTGNTVVGAGDMPGPGEPHYLDCDHRDFDTYSGTSDRGSRATNHPSSFSQSEHCKNCSACMPEEQLLCLPYIPNRSNQAKDRWISNTTFSTSHGACSLMMRNVSCNHMRQIMFISKLESDSIHCAFHQSIQNNMVVRLKACGTVTVRDGSQNSARNPFLVLFCVCVF